MLQQKRQTRKIFRRYKLNLGGRPVL